MMAVVISLVYRQIPGLSEILRVLESEGLLWVEPLSVSKQAISKRLRTLPACLFAQVFEQVMQRMQSTNTGLPVPQGWELVQQNFTALWIADGSTLEALRRKLKALKDQTTALGEGKLLTKLIVVCLKRHTIEMKLSRWDSTALIPVSIRFV